MTPEKRYDHVVPPCSREDRQKQRTALEGTSRTVGLVLQGLPVIEATIFFDGFLTNEELSKL